MDVLDEKSVSSRALTQADRAYVLAVARRFVGDPAAAEDVAQDALLLAFRHRDAFRGDSRYRTWLYRIAATSALGYLRRRRRSREELGAHGSAGERDIADQTRTPERLLADLEEAEHGARLVAQLAPAYRDVVLLRTVLDENATARRLGISVANVKVRAHRARRWLHDHAASAA